jgi:hypothetical protein
VTIPSLTAARYRIEWWETWRGKCLKSEPVEAGPAGLRIRFPALASDVALKIVAQ